ncbi:MAG: hypothetical protein AAFZ09_05025 [Pseudomonadota bacterium]
MLQPGDLAGWTPVAPVAAVEMVARVTDPETELASLAAALSAAIGVLVPYADHPGCESALDWLRRARAATASKDDWDGFTGGTNEARETFSAPFGLPLPAAAPPLFTVELQPSWEFPTDWWDRVRAERLAIRRALVAGGAAAPEAIARVAASLCGTLRDHWVARRRAPGFAGLKRVEGPAGGSVAALPLLPAPFGALRVLDLCFTGATEAERAQTLAALFALIEAAADAMPREVGAADAIHALAGFEAATPTDGDRVRMIAPPRLVRLMLEIDGLAAGETEPADRLVLAAPPGPEHWAALRAVLDAGADDLLHRWSELALDQILGAGRRPVLRVFKGSGAPGRLGIGLVSDGEIDHE